MLCQNCKAEVSDALILCPQCGHDLTAPPDPVVSEAVGVAPPPPQQARPAPRPVPVRSVEAPARRGSGFSGWVWALALGLLISCVVVAFVAAGLGGMYQGLKERDRLNQVLAGEHYNRGLEHFQANEPELAMAEFEEALRINPGYLEAYDKLKELRAKSRVQPTPTSALVRQAVGDILAEAQAQYDAGEWTSAISRLEQLKSLDAGFQADKVQEMLYDAYLKNANALLEKESPEEALRSFDAALAIQSGDEEVQTQQDPHQAVPRRAGLLRFQPGAGRPGIFGALPGAPRLPRCQGQDLPGPRGLCRSARGRRELVRCGGGICQGAGSQGG